MGRKQAKGKEPASSSSARGKKRRNLRLQEESESEEEQIPKPSWDKKVPLSSFHEVWQQELYMEKMSSLRNIENVLVCERAIAMPEFRAIGLVECFERLGWGAVLSFKGEGPDVVYQDFIVEWMSTLTKIDGSNPPRTMKLVGRVGDREVVMSLDTIKAIAPFDSRLAREYVYPEPHHILAEETTNPAWIGMLQEIFRPERGIMTRNCMRALPKLIHLIMGQNVIPRHGDKMKVRHYEIRVLHALLTGSPVFSFRHLAMLNVWESRESKERKMIPHCRLLSALMIRQGVVGEFSRSVPKPHKLFTLSRLSSSDWKYKKTDRYHVLKDLKGKEVIRGLRPDAPSVASGEVDEDEEMGQDSDGDEEANTNESESDEGPGESRSRGPQQAYGMTGTSGLVFEDELMEGIVRSRRPEEHSSWPRITQMNWDRESQNIELARRRHVELMDQHTLYARNQAFTYEQQVNDRYQYDEQVCHYNDYHAGVPYRAHPPPVDWNSLPPYSGGDRFYPYPQSQPSRWVPPQPAQGYEASGSGSSDPFNFQTMRDSLFEQWFGPPTPRSPYDPADYATH